MLGLSPDATNVAIQRLLRIGFMKMASPESWVDCTGDLTNLLDGIAYEAVWRLSERARMHAIGSALSLMRARPPTRSRQPTVNS